MTKYRVSIGYKKFTFNGRLSALSFADTAFIRSDDDESVSIELIRCNEPEEEDEADE